jgi:hypothetical protein
MKNQWGLPSLNGVLIKYKGSVLVMPTYCLQFHPVLSGKLQCCCIAKSFVVCVFKQGGFENMELARAHYCLALKLSPNNIRALYGLFLVRPIVLYLLECNAHFWPNYVAKIRVRIRFDCRLEKHRWSRCSAPSLVLRSVLVNVYQRIVFFFFVKLNSRVVFFFLVSVLVKVYRRIVFFFCQIEFVIKTHCCKECTFCQCALHSPADTFLVSRFWKLRCALDSRKYGILYGWGLNSHTGTIN